MSDLPSGWIVAKLSELATPRGERVPPAAHTDKQFIGLEHVESQTTRILGSVPAAQVKSSASLFRAGDVLYGRLRPYLNKVAKPDFDGLASAEFIVFPDQPHLRSGFLKHRLNAGDFASFATHLNAGDRPRVDFEQIGAFDIAVPPPAEQQRIVEKLEELLSDLDAGIAALEHARANLKRYRAAVLKAAVEGRLTEKWRAAHPGAEPAGKLLERILAERRKKWEEAQLKRYVEKTQAPPKGWKDKYVEPVKPDAETLHGLPSGWVCASLDQLLSAVTSGSRAWTKYYGRGSCIFIMAGNVRPMRLDLADRQVVDPPDGDVERERTRVQRADVLVTIVGANTGDVCSVDDDLRDHYVCQSVGLLRPADSSLSRFISIFLNAEGGGKTQFRRVMYGQGRPHLGLDDIRNVVIALPPMQEQEAMGEELERQLSICDGAEAQVDSDARRSSLLRQAILKRAFEGRLVPQDPKDKPASELLARIRAGREVGKGLIGWGKGRSKIRGKIRTNRE